MPQTEVYSAKDYARMRAAAKIIVARDDLYLALEPPYHTNPSAREMRAHELAFARARDGQTPAEIEREADKVAIEEGRAFMLEMKAGRAVRWQDPGYLDWCEKRGIDLGGVD